MTAHSIYNDLLGINISGDRAQEAARVGFFNWLVSLSSTESAQNEAKIALESVAMEGTETDAARLFREFLEQASTPITGPLIRRGGAAGRRQILH